MAGGIPNHGDSTDSWWKLSLQHSNTSDCSDPSWKSGHKPVHSDQQIIVKFQKSTSKRCGQEAKILLQDQHIRLRGAHNRIVNSLGDSFRQGRLQGYYAWSRQTSWGMCQGMQTCKWNHGKNEEIHSRYSFRQTTDPRSLDARIRRPTSRLPPRFNSEQEGDGRHVDEIIQNRMWPRGGCYFCQNISRVGMGKQRTSILLQ